MDREVESCFLPTKELNAPYLFSHTQVTHTSYLLTVIVREVIFQRYLCVFICLCSIFKFSRQFDLHNSSKMGVMFPILHIWQECLFFLCHIYVNNSWTSWTSWGPGNFKWYTCVYQCTVHMNTVNFDNPKYYLFYSHIFYPYATII